MDQYFRAGNALPLLGLVTIMLATSLVEAQAQTVQTTLVSRVRGSTNTTPGGETTTVDLSADGNYALFHHVAANLAAIDSNQATDAFVFSRSSGITTLVSGALSSATTTANFGSTAEAISSNGEYVLFRSAATNLLPNFADGNALEQQDVFLFHRPTRNITLVSRAATSAATSANGSSLGTAVSPDGRFVLFGSTASNLVSGVVDQNATNDAFVFDRTTTETMLVSRSQGSAVTTPNSASTPLGISSDGNTVLYASTATDIAAGVSDTNNNADLFLFDRATSETMLVSRAFDSARTGNRGTPSGLLSADGRVVALNSGASDLLAGIPLNSALRKIYLFDRASGVVTLASRALGSPTTPVNHHSLPVAVSADGKVLLFGSFANNFFPDERSGIFHENVFVFDLETEATTLISRALGSATLGADLSSFPVAMSADGNRILYSSDARNLVRGVTKTNGFSRDVYIFDRDNEMAGLVSRAAGSPNTTANHSSVGKAMSADGSRILFSSAATDVVPGVVDNNLNFDDAFLAGVGATPRQVIFRDGFD